MFRQLGLRRRGAAADSRRGVHVALPRGRPAGDRRADRRLQPDGRSPARRAGAAARSSTSSSSQVLHVSPSGVVILDFDERDQQPSIPAAERLLDRPARDGGRPPPRRRSARRWPTRSPRSRPARRASSGCSGARRVKCHHGTFVDRGFPRSFLLVEELTEELRQFERAAYEKLIRVMSHEVNNTVAASNSLLHSSLTYAARARRRRAATTSSRRIGIVIERTEQLNSFMRGFADVFRLPPPLLAAVRSRRRPRAASCGCSARGRTPPASRWRWELDQPSVRVPIDRGQMEQALLNILQERDRGDRRRRARSPCALDDRRRRARR